MSDWKYIEAFEDFELSIGFLVGFFSEKVSNRIWRPQGLERTPKFLHSTA